MGLWPRQEILRLVFRLYSLMRDFPSSKWVPISSQGRVRQRKERVCRLSSAAQEIQWVFNHTVTTANLNLLPIPNFRPFVVYSNFLLTAIRM